MELEFKSWIVPLHHVTLSPHLGYHFSINAPLYLSSGKKKKHIKCKGLCTTEAAKEAECSGSGIR